MRVGDRLRRISHTPGLAMGATVGAILLGAAALGLGLSLRPTPAGPSLSWLGLAVAALGGLALLAWRRWRLPFLIASALIVPLQFSTGTQVSLNPVTLLLPAFFVLWIADGMVGRELRLAPSRVNLPLACFLLANLFSLGLGNALWDPAVPRPGSFLVVQLGQWAIFCFSGLAFWLAGNAIEGQAGLRRLTWSFLVLGGLLAVLSLFADAKERLVYHVATAALIRAPFWVLLAGLVGGQLLYNPQMRRRQRLFLLAVLGAVLYYALVYERETASIWVGVAAAAAALLWLRYPRLRWPAIALLVLLAGFGVLAPALYQFAGGEAEWFESGGSRLTLIGRTLQVAMRNPFTGLGPASYRLYAGVEPLSYGKATWWAPQVSSHNNYVDMFAHGGLLGLGLFLWFAGEVAGLGLRLRAGHTRGFLAGYVNGVLAAGAGSLVIMVLGDWILPFVYNVGFLGFQASVLVWLFLGGLVAVEQPDG